METTQEKAVEGFKSRKPFFCSGCREYGKIGDAIKWTRGNPGSTYHADCFPTKEEGAPSSCSGDALQQLAKALNPFIVTNNTVSEIDIEKISELIDSKLSALTTPKSIKIERDNLPDVTIKNPHRSLESLIYIASKINPLTSKRYNVYLYGCPGSGKSTGARQVADALELKYGYISLNPQTPESRLIGYMDATGNYRSTVFFDLYTNGGVFCIDEQDNASPALLTTLNSLLENGHGSFPCGIVERHKDFRLISTGNTDGRGANIQFPERRAFDEAFRERFIFMPWAYDEALELNLSLGINPNATAWVKWVQSVRAYCLSSDIRLVVSPRASYMGADYLADKVIPIDSLLDFILFKNIDRGIQDRILSNCPLDLGAL